MTHLRNVVGHFHPALVHFPVALILAGAGLEAFSAVRGRGASAVARVLLLLGFLGALGAIASGLSLFHPTDFRGRALAVASVHRILGLATASASALAAAANGLPWRGELEGFRLSLYRATYALSAILVGLTGHYGGWLVFGWGSVWTF